LRNRKKPKPDGLIRYTNLAESSTGCFASDDDDDDDDDDDNDDDDEYTYIISALANLALSSTSHIP
jgi:hypothetical protein